MLYRRIMQTVKTHIVDILIVGMLTTIFLALLFHNIFDNPFYYFAADISELYFPWWVFMNSTLRSLQFPMLNPFWFAGSLPFAAMESSLFYLPYAILQIFFNAQKNLDIAYFFHFGMEISHYFLASISFFLLLRVGLKLERFSSIFGAIIYAASGVFIGRFVHPVVIQTLSWLPVVYLSYILFIEHQRIIFALATSAALFFVITSGHPQMIYYVYQFFLLAVVYLCFFYSKKNRAVLLGISVGIVILSFLLSSYRIFLGFELAQNVVRTTNETTIQNLYNSLHPLYYLTLLVPHLFGRHVIGYWGSDYPWGNWENYVYIGILPLLFLPFSLLWRNKKMLWFFYSQLGIVFFLLLGKYFWLSALVNRVMPLSETMTFLSKLTNFFHFFLVIICSIGLNMILVSKNNTKLKIGLFATIVVFGFILFLLNDSTLMILQPAGRRSPSITAIDYALRSLALSRFLFILSGASFFIFILRRNTNFAYIMVIIYALDIFLTSGNFNPIEASPGPPSRYFGTNSFIEELKKDPTIYRVHNLWPRNINMVQLVESTYGYHTIETKSYHDLISLMDFHNKNIFDITNIKYVISDQNLFQYGHFIQKKPNLWENTSVLPRIVFIPNYRVVVGKNDMVQVLLSPQFDPGKEVVLYQTSKIPEYLNNVSHNDRLTSTAHVTVNRVGQTDYEVGVNTQQSGFLFFSQPQYPGWYAVVDGKRQELLAANLSFYALPIDKGNHRVQFIYQSKPARYGVFLASLTGILILLSFIMPRVREYYFKSLQSSYGKHS